MLAAPMFTALAAWGMRRYTLANPDLVGGGFVSWRTAATPEDVAAAEQLASGLDLLTGAAFALALLPLALVAAAAIVSATAGRQQATLAAAFPPLIQLALWTMLLVVVGHVALLLAALWFAERIFVNGLHMFFFWPMALAAFLLCLRLARAGLVAIQPIPLDVCADILGDETHGRLTERVRAVALKLGARPPDWVIAGLEPSFYITACDVRVAPSAQTLHGETLHVSLPFMGLLSAAEFDAVVGHELGHFRGGDTGYSRRFVPIYARLHTAMGVLSDRGGRVPLPVVPSYLVLDLLLRLFDGAQQRLARERELDADIAALDAAGNLATASALLKVTLHAAVVEAHLSGVFRREVPAETLISEIAREASREIRPEEWRSNLAIALEQTTPHPTDSHPPLSQRLAATGIEPQAITPGMLTPPSNSAAALIPDAAEICAAQVAWLDADFEAAAVSSLSPILGAIADGLHDPAGGFARG